MRMQELAGCSGVPAATIKFYLRTGLLAPGVRTASNQARYTGEHVRRLRLIRVLLEAGGLSLAKVGELLAVIDGVESPAAGAGLPDRLASVTLTEDDRDWARVRVSRLVAAGGWNPTDPAAEALVGVLGAYRSLGHADLLDRLDDYVEAAAITGEPGAPHTERTVVGLVLGDVVLALLRRLAMSS